MDRYREVVGHGEMSRITGQIRRWFHGTQRGPLTHQQNHPLTTLLSCRLLHQLDYCLNNNSGQHSNDQLDNIPNSALVQQHLQQGKNTGHAKHGCYQRPQHSCFCTKGDTYILQSAKPVELGAHEVPEYTLTAQSTIDTVEQIPPNNSETHRPTH